jgi:purine-binding chemotaxis protein CheW
MPNQVSPNPILRYIRCTLGAENFALDMADVYSVQRDNSMRKNTASNIPAGWFPLREGEAPVYYLANLLGRADLPQTRQQRVVIMRPLQGGSHLWGLLVDQVSEVFTIQRDALVPLPGMRFQRNSCFASAISQGEDLIPLIDTTRLSPARMDLPGDDVLEFPSVEEPVSRLPAWQARQARQDGSRGGASRANQLILFSLAGSDLQENFAISTVQVLEILAPLNVIPVPGAAQWVLGYVKWRNRAVPLVDLFCRFGLLGQYNLRNARLMIVRVTSRTQMENVFGILVDANIRILRLPTHYRECETALAIPPAFIKGVVEFDRRVTIIPDMQKVFFARMSDAGQR